MARPRVWLITGASSGFGKALTEFVLSQGDIVVATLRKPEVLQSLAEDHPKDRLLVLKLDVTIQGEIDHTFAQIKNVFGRLDVVFNNAGYAVFGDAETTQISTARAMFDVNFWGAVSVSRSAIKFFREVNQPGRGGVLLQNSSITGIESEVGLAFYSASKHGETFQSWATFGLETKEHVAFNGFSESLAKEILPEWNIKICIIGAGGFSTNAVANADISPENPVYNHKASGLQIIRNRMTAPGFKFQGDPAKFARAIHALVKSGSMPLHLPIGKDALAVAKLKLESLGRDVLEASSWSADLLRDGVAKT